MPVPDQLDVAAGDQLVGDDDVVAFGDAPERNLTPDERHVLALHGPAAEAQHGLAGKHLLFVPEAALAGRLSAAPGFSWANPSTVASSSRSQAMV